MNPIELSQLIDNGWELDKDDDVISKDCAGTYCLISPASVGSKLYIDGVAEGKQVETALQVSQALEAHDLLESLLNENYDRTNRGLANAFMESPLYSELSPAAKQAFAHNDVSGIAGFFGNNDFDAGDAVDRVENSLTSGNLKFKLDPKLKEALPEALAAFRQYLAKKGVRRPELASSAKRPATIMEMESKVYTAKVRVTNGSRITFDKKTSVKDDLVGDADEYPEDFLDVGQYATLKWSIELEEAENGIERIWINPIEILGVEVTYKDEPLKVEWQQGSFDHFETYVPRPDYSSAIGLKIDSVELEMHIDRAAKIARLGLEEINLNLKADGDEI